MNIFKKKLIISIIIVSVLFLTSCTSGGEKMNIAKFETNRGYFKIQLFTEEMPITTKNFIDLAEKNFYDGSRFHRIIGPKKSPPLGFMIQGGDPLSKDTSKKNMWGTGGPGYNIKDEFTNNNRNDAGTISMANSGPNTGGSQFFINLGNNNFLDDKHPVFGKVIEGMQIVKKIGNVDTNMGDQPLEEVIIEKITIE